MFPHFLVSWLSGFDYRCSTEENVRVITKSRTTSLLLSVFTEACQEQDIIAMIKKYMFKINVANFPVLLSIDVH